MPRSVVITGGSEGIGRALGERMAADGWEVYALGRYASHADAGGFHTRAGDVRHPHVIEAIMLEAARTAPLLALVNCAGVVYPATLAELDATAAHQEIVTNLTGAVMTTNAFLRYSAGPRVVVMMSSTSGMRPSPGWAVYGATKAAMISLGRSLAAENPDINVVTICPGRTATRLRRAMAPDEDPLSIQQPGAVAAATLFAIDAALDAGGEQIYIGDPITVSGGTVGEA